MPNIVLNRPHSGQADIYAHASKFDKVDRYVTLACGRRFGKTNLMQTIGCKRVLCDPQPVGWFAPNYKYLKEPYAALQRILQPITVAKNHERFIALANGVRIDFWTMEDINAGRGYKYGLALVDEVGMVNNMAEVWENAISPTLVDLEGSAVFSGTPKGRNYFHNLFQRGLDGVPGWRSFQKPTSSNPVLPASAYDMERLLAEGLPERVYRQEYLAEFIEDAGGVFIGVGDVIDRGRTQNQEPVRGGRYFAGIDLAQTQDWTVVCIFDQGGNQVYFDRFQRLSWELTTSRIETALKLFDATGVVDATGVGQPIFESLRQRGCRVEPFKFTAQSKAGLIESAVAIVQRRDVHLLDIPAQEEELRAFEYEVTKGGNVRMAAPEGMHDDAVIAFALAVSAMSRPALDVFV